MYIYIFYKFYNKTYIYLIDYLIIKIITLISLLLNIYIYMYASLVNKQLLNFQIIFVYILLY